MKKKPTNFHIEENLKLIDPEDLKKDMTTKKKKKLTPEQEFIVSILRGEYFEFKDGKLKVEKGSKIQKFLEKHPCNTIEKK